MSTSTSSPDSKKAAIRHEFETTREDFQALVRSVDRDGWGRPSKNPGWTNGEVLFHMALGFMLLPLLTPLLRGFGRLPRPCSKAFATLLNRATPLFNRANAIAPRVGSRLYRGGRLAVKFDGVHARMLRLLDALPEAELARGMHYPDRWEPLFRSYMALEDLFHYPPAHVRFHRDQLSMPGPVA